MPVTKQASVSYTLLSVFFDVPSATAVAQFSRAVDGQEVNQLEMRLSGTDVAPFLMGVPDSEKPRRDDITDAVYALAISKGIIDGAIS